MTLNERVEAYQKAFPKFPSPQVAGEDGRARIYGIWIMGQNYRVKSGYYGGYPHGYLDRVMALFPEKKRILHLFSGKAEKPDDRFHTFDINPDLCPDYVGDAEDLAVRLENDFLFDLILADPPYSSEDAIHYGTAMVNRNRVLSQCRHVLTPGGHVVWLDQVFPQFRKTEFSLVGAIGMVKSTNHRVRSVFIFEKVEKI